MKIKRKIKGLLLNVLMVVSLIACYSSEESGCTGPVDMVMFPNEDIQIAEDTEIAILEKGSDGRIIENLYNYSSDAREKYVDIVVLEGEDVIKAEENAIKIIKDGSAQFMLKFENEDTVIEAKSPKIVVKEDIKTEKYTKILESVPDFMEIGTNNIYVLGNRINEDGTENTAEYGITVLDLDFNALNFKSILEERIVNAYVDEDDNLYIESSGEKDQIVKYNSNLEIEDTVDGYSILGESNDFLLLKNKDTEYLATLKNDDFAIKESDEIELWSLNTIKCYIDEQIYIMEYLDYNEVINIKIYDHDFNLENEKNILLRNGTGEVDLRFSENYNYLIMNHCDDIYPGTRIWKLDKNFKLLTERNLDGFYAKEFAMTDNETIIGRFEGVAKSIYNEKRLNCIMAFNINEQGIDYFQSYDGVNFEFDFNGNDIYLRTYDYSETKYEIEKFRLNNM